MVTFRGSLAETIFDQIEFLYVDQVGPIGSVLIQESLNTWMADLRSKNLKASLRHIPRYLEILAQDIGEESDRKNFINSVFEIPALSHYKQLYKGSV